MRTQPFGNTGSPIAVSGLHPRPLCNAGAICDAPFAQALFVAIEITPGGQLVVQRSIPLIAVESGPVQLTGSAGSIDFDDEVAVVGQRDDSDPLYALQQRGWRI